MPTFNQDLAPIVFSRCASCHQSGGAAPNLALTSYSQVRALAAKIKTQVATRAMPPWPPDPEHSAPLRDDGHLAQHDIDQLIAWADGGMPEGPPRTVPLPIPPATLDWSHPLRRAPDLVFSLPEVHIPASGEIPYMRVLIPVTLPEDRWVVGLQTLPGDPSVVHHMGIAEVELPPGMKTESVERQEKLARRLGLPPGTLDATRPAVIDERLSGEGDMFAAFTPGIGFEGLPEGSGKLLRGGGNFFINFNVHYTASGTPTTDRSRIGIWFASATPERQVFRVPASGKSILANGVLLFPDDPGSKAEGTDVAIPPIPPNSDDYELVGITAYPLPVTLYDFQPHAHLRGKDFVYYVVFPDGQETTLLTIPHYDFHWQLNYALQTPLALPAGSKLVVTAHYDNSVGNRHLREVAAQDPGGRCGPDKYVFFRSENQTWDEMFSPIVEYGIDGPASGSVRASKVRAQVKPIAGDRDPAGVDLVAVTGCLARDDKSPWTLRRASEARPTQQQSITRRELAATVFTPGEGVYGVVGMRPFAQSARAGQAVLVKGLRIQRAALSSLNVTAVQPLKGHCD